MNDRETTIDELKALVLAFAVERDWVQFHQPKDLGLALASEVGELLDLFRFRTDERVATMLGSAEGSRAVAHELADCLWSLLRLAEVCQIDLASSLREKVALAAIKYPTDRSYGRSDKYTTYQTEARPDDDIP